jgi:hypothetical protein
VLAHVLGALAEVEVFAEAFGFGARALGHPLGLLGPAARRLARRPRALLDALADAVLLVQLARLTPRRLAPFLKPVLVISHSNSRNNER